MNGYFITGTGTDVGKTYVTGLLLGTLRNAGVDAISIKPVQTGCVPSAVVPDLEEHWRLAGWRPTAEWAARCAPFQYADAVSPHLAAAREGRPLVLAQIVAAVNAVATEHAAVLVEGAGGVLVPLNECETMLDLMVAMALPVVVVAAAGVGTINHTLLTLQALRAAGLAVAAVVLNEIEQTDPTIAADNAAVIAQLGNVRVLGPVGRSAPACPDLTPLLAAFQGEKFMGGLTDL